MNLDQDFFQESKLSEDTKKVFIRNGTLIFPEFSWRPKKKVFTRNGTLFLSTDLRSDAHQSQIIGGDADEDHTQIGVLENAGTANAGTGKWRYWENDSTEKWQ